MKPLAEVKGFSYAVVQPGPATPKRRTRADGWSAIDVPVDLRRRLSALAEGRDITLRAITIEAVTDYLDAHETRR